MKQIYIKKKILYNKKRSKRKFHTGIEKLCGYSIEERTAFEKLLKETNMVDCFRSLYPSVCDQFTWFNIRIKNSFSDNIGWLIDRFLLQEKYKHTIEECKILYEIGTRNKLNF